jgi:hypothetical protein
MKRLLKGASLVAATLALPAFAFAGTVGPIDFESYALGNINGQDGWTSTGSYDQGVVNSPVISGAKSFRISNSVTSGSFGDQTFSKPLTDSAGEVGSDSSGFPQGTLQPHFESQFTLEAIPNSIGDIMSVSPDTGNGGRMSYLRFDNESDGIHVYFDDVQGTSNPANFVETALPTLNSSVSHTVKFVIDFVDGPSNDVVKIYIDGTLEHRGSTWENYYRYDSESNPALNHSFTHSVRSMLFRAAGTAVTANAGKGFLIDDLSLSSTTPPPASCPAGTTQSSSPIETVAVNSNNAAATPSTSVLANGTNYLLVSSGTWQNTNLNAADTEYASVDNWTTVMDGYDITPYFLGAGEFDLQVNDAFVNWGSYSTNHSYSYLYAGTGSPVNLGVFDGDSNTNTKNAGWYGDNTGSLSVAIYSCDPVVQPPPTDPKEQCKNNGWKTMVDDQQHHFKNQGDCVSFFATKGKNKAAGN